MNHHEHAALAYETTQQRFQRVREIMRRTGAKRVRLSGGLVYLDGSSTPWAEEDPQPATPRLDAAQMDLI